MRGLRKKYSGLHFKLLDIVPDLRGSTVKLISVQFGLMQTLDSYH